MEKDGAEDFIWINEKKNINEYYMDVYLSTGKREAWCHILKMIIVF